MADGVHEDGGRDEGLAVVEPEHLDPRVVWSVGVEPDDRPAIDDLAPVDAKADPAFPVADGNKLQPGDRFLRRGTDFRDEGRGPGRVFTIARRGMVVRGGDHDVGAGDAGVLLDALPKGGHHFVPGANGIARYDRGSGFAIIKHQDARPQWVPHTRDLPPVAADGDGSGVIRRDIDLRHAGAQV